MGAGDGTAVVVVLGALALMAAMFVIGAAGEQRRIVKACDTFNVVLLETKSGDEIYVCAKRSEVEKPQV